MKAYKLFDSAKTAEALRLTAYQDSRGVWTIGYGRNLQVLRISKEQAEQWFNEDMQQAITAAQSFPEYTYLDTDARQNAFIEMVFNMGASKVRGFKKMLAAIRLRGWASVADEALDSDWAKQVGNRAQVLAKMLETGEFPTV